MTSVAGDFRFDENRARGVVLDAVGGVLGDRRPYDDHALQRAHAAAEVLRHPTVPQTHAAQARVQTIAAVETDDRIYGLDGACSVHAMTEVAGNERARELNAGRRDTGGESRDDDALDTHGPRSLTCTVTADDPMAPGNRRAAEGPVGRIGDDLARLPFAVNGSGERVAVEVESSAPDDNIPGTAFSKLSAAGEGLAAADRPGHSGGGSGQRQKHRDAREDRCEGGAWSAGRLHDLHPWRWR